ncbi:MAG: hypothetical protein CM1200mP30_19310 [Pseudomonadota bacterium]|nr:MAG: hypothetical protein CM1200mP30_19310 [Pseudomonadota bacterium]
MGPTQENLLYVQAKLNYWLNLLDLANSKSSGKRWTADCYDEVTDKEFRYRQRYVDLILNPHVSEVFRKRALIFQTIRNYLLEEGFLEVETPTLQSVYGGANATPFVTHHKSLDQQFFLRISNELYLKRLIAGGFDAVFEFVKDFRNEGIDRTHNPEFSAWNFIRHMLITPRSCIIQKKYVKLCAGSEW